MRLNNLLIAVTFGELLL